MKGSVQQRGKRWRVVFDRGVGADGRRRQIVRSAPTKEAAEALLRELLVEHGNGIEHNGDVTVGELLDQWMRLKRRTLSVTAALDYQRVIDVHVPARLAATKVYKVRTHDLDVLYVDRAEHGLGNARIQRLDTIMRGAFGQAVRWQWIARNPATEASRPSVRRTEPEAPEVAEVKALIAKADSWLVVWIRLAAHLGARRGEMAALRWSDFDLDAGRVRISRALADGGPGVKVVEKETKTDRIRTLSIGPKVLAEVRRYRRSQLATAMAAGITVAPGAFVFSRDAGGVRSLRPDAVTREFARLRNDLGLRHVKLKNLRHFVFTQMIAAGVDIRTVSQRAGHERTSTTLDIYAAWVPGNDAAAAEGLDELVG